MADIWLPGLPPVFTNWSACAYFLRLLMPTEDDARILAAIGGPESDYDMSVINDTPATGDYSVGVFQINYLGALYAERSARWGTPRQLIEGGVVAQTRAAAELWHEQGWDAWSTTYTSGRWRAFIGSGPIPVPSGPGGTGGTITGPYLLDSAALDQATKAIARDTQAVVGVAMALQRMGRPGWRL